MRRYKVPKGYPNIYPPPPHIPLDKRIAAIHELRRRDDIIERSLKQRVLSAIGARILNLYVRLIYRTSRQLEFTIHPATQALIDDPKGQFIVALWHNRLMYCIYSLADNVAGRGHDILAIISQSKDAEFIARAAVQWGAFAARGSSTRGGTAAIKKIIKYTKLHFHPLVTPDGPKGPAYKVKEGLVALARLTNLPVVPICFDAQSKWVVNSWDKFIIPKPFSKTVLNYGEPIYIDKKMKVEDSALLLEKIMMQQVEYVEDRLKELTENK